MKKNIWIPALRLIRAGTSFAGMTVMIAGMTMAVAMAAEPVQIQLKLDDSFKKELQCAWKTPLKFWVGAIEDERASKELGLLMTKKEETPVFSDQPVAKVVQEALKEGIKKCGFKEVGNQEGADIVITGQLEEFSGSSKKGILKGEAKGAIDLTLHLIRVQDNSINSVSFSVEEVQKKGISKKPKKFEEMLNRLLTRLTVDVLESRNIGEWLVR